VLDKLITGTDCIDPTADRNPLISSRKPKEKSLQSVACSALYQISIPDTLTTRTYGKLFELLTQENILPLGILRGVFSNMSSGAKGNKMPYVYTNPHKDTELFTCDRVFVLSPRSPESKKTSSKAPTKVSLASVSLSPPSSLSLSVCLSLDLSSLPPSGHPRRVPHDAIELCSSEEEDTVRRYDHSGGSQGRVW
jgi:hypothetical protein